MGRYQAIQFMPDPAVVIIIRIISYSDKIIECVVVESKEKIKAVFIGDTKIEMVL